MNESQPLRLALILFITSIAFAVFGAAAILLLPPPPTHAHPLLSTVNHSSLAVTSSASLTWTIQCVDCPKYFENMRDRSLRLDANGHPHIAYGGDHLYYAWYDGDVWHYYIVDTSASVGSHAALALDTAGNPHISYHSSQGLGYAHWDGLTWIIQTVDSALAVGSYNSLALDTAGHPHISYYDAIYTALKYAQWDGLAWDIQTVDSAGSVGQYTSLALDAAGAPTSAITTTPTKTSNMPIGTAAPGSSRLWIASERWGNIPPWC